MFENAGEKKKGGRVLLWLNGNKCTWQDSNCQLGILKCFRTCILENKMSLF